VLAATQRDPGALAPEIRRSLMDADLRMAPVLGIAAMRARIAESLTTPRFQLALIGGFAGVAVLLAAIGLTQVLRGFLYRLSPVDPLAFIAGLVVVVIAVLVASIRPAGRAARVDPMVSMRTEG